MKIHWMPAPKGHFQAYIGNISIGYVYPWQNGWRWFMATGPDRGKHSATYPTAQEARDTFEARLWSEINTGEWQ